MIRKNSTTPTSNERMAVYSSTACNCCSFILLVFSFIAPFVLWGTYGTNGNQVSMGYALAGNIFQTTVVVGPPSTSTQTYYWIPQGVYWSTIEMLNPCANTKADIFTKWALPNGFCVTDSSTTSGYKYQAPTAISAAFATGLTSALFSLSSFGVLCATTTNGSTIFVASLLGYFACSMAIATFSIWASFGYGQMLRSEEGATILAYMTDDESEPVIGVLGPVNMWLGPSWSVTLTSAIILFVTSTILMVIAANIDKRRNNSGAFGSL